jgi:hypothetical protein
MKLFSVPRWTAASFDKDIIRELLEGTAQAAFRRQL